MPEACSPKLLDQVRQAIRRKYYSIRTEDAYGTWIRRFILYNHKHHPAQMGKPEIESLLAFLTFIGLNMFRNAAWADPDLPFVITAIYGTAMLCYAVLIPIYVVVVVQLLRRIKQLKKKVL